MEADPFEYASLVQRLAAFFIDAVIQFVIFFLWPVSPWPSSLHHQPNPLSYSMERIPETPQSPRLTCEICERNSVKTPRLKN